MLLLFSGQSGYLALNKKTDFQGVYLATLSADSSSIVVSQRTAPFGGIGGLNLKPPTSGSPTVTLNSHSITAEGAASAYYTFSATLSGMTFDDTIASIDVSYAIAGTGNYHPWTPAVFAPSTGSVSGVVHGLAAQQGYDIALQPRGQNGQALGAPLVLGTSPTVSASAITAVLTNGNLPAMPSGATITASSITATVFDGGMHTGFSSAYIPELNISFTLGDSNSPNSTQWGNNFVVGVRQHSASSPTDPTTYTLRSQPSVAPSALGNGSAQTVVTGPLTPGASYDVVIALCDKQGGPTPYVQILSNYAVPQVSSGAPVGPIWGRPHMLPIGTDPTNGIWDTTSFDHGVMSTGVQSAVDASGDVLNVNFPGGKLQADGALSNVDGVSSTEQYTLASGQPFTVSADIAAGGYSSQSAILIGDLTNGYAVESYAGNARILKYVGGVQTTIKAQSNINDLKYHSYRLTITPGASNSIEASFDSISLTATDSALTLTSGTWPMTLCTGGSAGKVLHFTASATPTHYGTLPPRITAPIIPPWTTLPGDGSPFAGGVIFGRHFGGASSADTGTVMDSSGLILYSRHAAPIRSVIDASSNILNVEFSGAKLQSDGSLTNVDGASSARTIPLSSGSVVRLKAVIAKGSTANNAGVRLYVNANNYYEFRYDGNGQYYVGYVFGAGSFTPITSAPSFGSNDTNPHTFLFTLVVGSPNTLYASIDGKQLGPVNDSTISGITSLGIMPFTGGSSGRMRDFSCIVGNEHYAAMSSEYQGNFDSSGNMKSSASMKTYIPNTMANIVSNITVQSYSASSGSLVFWFTSTVASDNPGGSTYPSWRLPDGTGIYPGYKHGASTVCGTGSSSPPSGFSFTGLSNALMYIGIKYDIANDAFTVVYGPTATQVSDSQFSDTTNDGAYMYVIAATGSNTTFPAEGGGAVHYRSGSGAQKA